MAVLLGFKDPETDDVGEVSSQSDKAKVPVESLEERTENIPKFY